LSVRCKSDRHFHMNITTYSKNFVRFKKRRFFFYYLLFIIYLVQLIWRRRLFNLKDHLHIHGFYRIDIGLRTDITVDWISEKIVVNLKLFVIYTAYTMNDSKYLFIYFQFNRFKIYLIFFVRLFKFGGIKSFL